MKRFVNFSIYEAESESEICGNTLRAKEMKHLRINWPQFFPPDLVGFHLRAELGDAVINDVIAYLHTTGRGPNWNWCPSLPWAHATLYQIKGDRVWEKADLDKAEYFELNVKWEICKGTMLPPDGIPEAEFGTYKGKSIGFLENFSNPICSVNYRAELEAQNLRGLTFRPVKIKSRKPEKLVLWQIWSKITLPPVLTPTAGVDGEPFDPATSKACYVNDIYFPWQHHYAAAEVRKLKPFDIAISTERWGYGPAHRREPAIIVSRRFREWFMTQKVPVEWWPVALE